MARANRVREIWAEGRAVVNSWLGIPSSFSAEEGVISNWDDLEWLRKGWPASRHLATVSEMIFTEAEAI